MVDTLQRYNISIFFTIGAAGTLIGASKIVEQLKRRNAPISVIGIPKTIDNDLNWITQSFNFAAAVKEALRAIIVAQAEAQAA